MVDSELFSRNLVLFQQRFPELTAQLTSRVPQAQLLSVGADDWDITCHGVRLYGMGAKAYAERQLDVRDVRIWQNLRVGSLLPQYIDRTGKDFYEFLLSNLAEMGLNETSLMERPLREQSYHVISLGLGLGVHLPLLQEKTQCRSLVVVESDLDRILCSLQVLDWQALLDSLDHFAIVWSSKQTQAIAQVQAAVIDAGPALLDGTRLLLHYADTYHANVGNGFSADAEAVCRGLGFMDDDVRMVRNTFLNLKNPEVRLWQQCAKPREWPVMVVGSGPSLDDMIEDVRRNAPHALVVAAGTAVPALLRYGIQPDFCTVLENGPEQYALSADTAERYPEQLRRIVLLGSSTIDPRLPPLFDRSVLALRPGLASALMFERDGRYHCPDIGPTVTNTALSLFLASGFDDVVLFGADLGAKVPEQHHSRASQWMDGTVTSEMTAFKPSDMTTEVRGNFGGRIFCHYIFNWARMTMEAVLAEHGRVGAQAGHGMAMRRAQIRNCSDGALIKGAHPYLAKKLNFPSLSTTKAEAVADFLADFHPYSHADMVQAWNTQRLYGQLDDLQQHLETAIQGKGLFQPTDSLETALRTFPPNAARRFLHGTLQMQAIMLYAVLNRIAETERELLTAKGATELCRNITTYTQELKEFIADLDAGRINGPWLRTPSGAISEH